MSTRQQDEGPRDWRRRRRRPPQEQSAQPDPAAPEEIEDPSADEPEEQTSRTLASFLDPAVDVVGIFGAPLLVAGIIGLVTGIVVVAFVSSMRLYGWIDIAIGASLIGLVGAVFISTVIAAFLSRTGRYGINTLILLGAFIGIVIVINVVSFENKQRSDVTATNQFSLSERTKDLLGDLEDDVRATAFYKALEETPDANVAARRNRVVDTLDEFSARSGKFTYRVVDPDLEPGVVASYFGARPTDFVSETVVIENLTTGEFDSLQPTDIAFGQLEQDLVTSLYIATGLEQKTVYFLGGHGERNLDGGGGDGYALLRQALEQENYQARGLVWPRNSTEVEVPEDAGAGGGGRAYLRFAGCPCSCPGPVPAGPGCRGSAKAGKRQHDLPGRTGYPGFLAGISDPVGDSAPAWLHPGHRVLGAWTPPDPCSEHGLQYNRELQSAGSRQQ